MMERSGQFFLLSVLCFCILFVEQKHCVIRPAKAGEAVGTLTFRFVTFANTKHLISTGAGCDIGWFGSRLCDPRFTICFKHTGDSEANQTHQKPNNQDKHSKQRNGTDPKAVDRCDFAGPFHCGPYDNTGEIAFSSSLCNYANPMMLNITRAWTGVEMRVRVDEMERGSFLGSNTAVGPLIDAFSYVFSARPSRNNTIKLRLLGSTQANTSLAVEAQVSCLPNYYNVKCSTFCMPSTRYDCNSNTGQPVCKAGWSGDDCTARDVSEELTIHPLSHGSQVDQMIVYEVQESTITGNTTSVPLLEDMNATADVQYSHSSNFEVVDHFVTEEEDPHFDHQSSDHVVAANATEHAEVTTNGGVTTVQPTTLSSIWPLTVSLLVGSFSVYATTSSPAPPVTSTKLPASAELTTVTKDVTTPVSTTVMTEKSESTLMAPSAGVTSANPDQLVAEECSDCETTTGVDSNVVVGDFTAPSTSTTTPPETAVTNFVSTKGPRHTEPNVAGLVAIHTNAELTTGATTGKPGVSKSSVTPTSVVHVSQNETNSVTATQNGKTAGDAAVIHISQLPSTPSTMMVLPTANLSTTATLAVPAGGDEPENMTNLPVHVSSQPPDRTTNGPVTEENLTTTVRITTAAASRGTGKGRWTLLTSAGSTVSTPAPSSATTTGKTWLVMNLAQEFKPSNLNVINDTSRQMDANHNKSTKLTVFPVSLETSSATPSARTSVSTMPVIGNVTTPGSLEQHQATVSTTESTKPIIDPPNGGPPNTTKVSSESAILNKPDPHDAKIPSRTFQLHSGLRFPGTLSNMGYLDELNSSVHDAVETLIWNDYALGKNLTSGLKTAVEFTGILINSTAIVPQITLFASLNGQPILSDHQFGLVLEEAITNLRQNATVTANGVPVYVTTANASSHPVMVFLIALLSVAIVVLLGIITVLMRKPKTGRCQTGGPFSDQEQVDMSSSFDSFSSRSTSAYENMAFSEPRLRLTADDEMISLEPSASAAQERLFARRTAVHSIQSPAAAPRLPVHVDRTTSTFKKSTI